MTFAMNRGKLQSTKKIICADIMMKRLLLVGVLMALCSTGMSTPYYYGRYCEGKGDAEYLRLIDQSFGFFHPNPDTPNISMLYYPEWDCLIEGFPTWMAWWVQNSYGTTYCALPFLREPYLTFLQHSQDMWFKNQGDGKTKREHDLVGPDGCLCDCAFPTGAHMVQGDCNWKIHDWGFEFTAAGVVMQSELLLISRDVETIRKYLPNLERACDFIETRRDANGLFLVGPAANLLAPSFGGVLQPDGTFGKAYLAGLSITYLAALDRMVELYKLAGDSTKSRLYEKRRKKTQESLSQLLTDEGYFVKFIETNGTKHGVFGQEKYGYFEVAPNVDAICFRAVSDEQSHKIYNKIAAIPQLRPYDFLITNYPSLDDTYENWDSTDLAGLWEFGRWVNGGVWSTMEARAIMSYYRLGKYEDIIRSARRSMDFARDFQMDAPLKNFGKSVWFDDRLTNLCYDALGIPAATIRGLFEYIYRADALILYPHIPPQIMEYTQKETIRWGNKHIKITVKNGGQKIKSVKINDLKWKGFKDDCVTLRYDRLPKHAWVVIETTGGNVPVRTVTEQTGSKEVRIEPSSSGDLPAHIKEPYERVIAMLKKLCQESDVAFERSYLEEVLSAFDAYRKRAARDSAGWYGDSSPEKRAAVLKMYEDAAINMFKGFDALMKAYESGDSRKRRIASTYANLHLQ